MAQAEGSGTGVATNWNPPSLKGVPEKTVEVRTGVPGWMAESPKTEEGASLLSKENPFSEADGIRGDDGEVH